MPPHIDLERCKGCQRCYDYCPLDVIGFDEEKKIPVVLYPDECWHCGVCEIECQAGAVDVVLPFKARGV